MLGHSTFSQCGNWGFYNWVHIPVCIPDPSSSTHLDNSFRIFCSPIPVLVMVPVSCNTEGANKMCIMIWNYVHVLKFSHLHITHYSHAIAGSPTVTSLTFDDQSRTLTCTSTGGPATNVTLRRNGVVITPNHTNHQTKRLVGPVNGTYQTVLTIDPSVGWSDIVGTYNCTVENARGGSSETVVVPGKIWTLICYYCSNIPLF